MGTQKEMLDMTSICLTGIHRQSEDDTVDATPCVDVVMLPNSALDG